MRFRQIGLYIRTLKYLRPSQVFWQIAYRIYRPRKRNVPVLARRYQSARWCMAIPKQSKIQDGKLCCLNEAHRIDDQNIWACESASTLWKYNLHYFDYLNHGAGQLDHNGDLALVERWIEEHPSGIGWQPYPISLRIVNWIRFSLEKDALGPEAIGSLCAQADLLNRLVEYHIGANHLFTNGKALLFAGLFFDGQQAEAWKRKGLKILRREIAEQFLPDGGHYERSPMYHAILTEDLLDLWNLCQAYRSELDDQFLAQLRERICRALDWLAAMTTSVGSFPLFGDAVNGIAPTPKAIFEYVQRMGFSTAGIRDGSTWLKDSGFLRLAIDDRRILFASVAGPMPDHQPGHAHADTFTFEVFDGDRAIIVDSGVNGYAATPERLRVRKTAAHNTLQIGDVDSSEVWSSFRVGRRARVSSASYDETEERVIFQAEHDGFSHLAGSPIHKRSWDMNRVTKRLTIVDQLSGTGNFPIAIRFRAGVGLSWQLNGDNAWVLCEKGMVLLQIETDPSLQYAVIEDVYYPEMGLKHSVSVLFATGLSNGAPMRHQLHFPQ